MIAIGIVQIVLSVIQTMALLTVLGGMFLMLKNKSAEAKNE